MKIIFHYEASNISEVNNEISSKNEHQTYGDGTLRKYFRKPREIFKGYSRFYHQEWMDKGNRLLCLPPHRNHYVVVVDPFDQLPTVISPASLDRWSRSFFSGQFFSLCLSSSFSSEIVWSPVCSFPLVFFLFPLHDAGVAFPPSAGSIYMYILGIGIDQPPLYHGKTCTLRFIVEPHYGDTSARGFAGINCHSNGPGSWMTVTVDDAEKLQGTVSSICSIDLPRLTKYVDWCRCNGIGKMKKLYEFWEA